MPWKQIVLLTACSWMAAATLHAAQPAPPRVAVFSQPGFPTFNIPLQTSPEKVEAALDAAGVPADSLDAAALSDPDRFNARQYGAVVLPYGNAYPQTAFENLRAFHRAGGSLILSGVPFTHAVSRESGGAWRDLGHSSNPAMFGTSGIGVGGFLPALPGRTAIPKNDPLGLKGLRLTWSAGDRVQPLDPSTIPAHVELIPALTAGGRPLASLLIHKGGLFSGAVDVWTTFAPHFDEGMSAFLTEQMLARGVVAALAHKGLVSPAHKSRAFKVLDRLPRPEYPANIVLPRTKRPYPTLQPKQPTPARTLYLVDGTKLRRDEQLLLASLQGIVNRTQPRIYVIWREDDRFWFDQMRSQGHTGEPKIVSDPLSLVETFRSSIKGAVVPDPKVYTTPSVAVSLAGIEDVVVATPELAERLRLPIKIDLRGKFKDNPDALRYVRTELWPRLNPFLAICLDPVLLGSQIDYIVANRGLAFWITGPRAQDRPGANGVAERKEVEAILAQMPLNAVVHGFWWHGEGVGMDESAGVSLASRFGKITTVSDYTANYSVTSGIRLDALKQKPQPPAPKLDPNKVYIALTVSDGDNLVTWRDFFYKQFRDPLHGTFPVAWGMGPSLIDVSPVQAQWYYENAAPTDEIFCDVSGAGYIDTTDWGLALKDRTSARKSFFDLTQAYMDRMDMKTVRFMRPSVVDIEEAGQDLKGVKFFVPDYGNNGVHDYKGLTYTLPTGQPVFRAVADSNAANMAAQVRQRVGPTRPAFINLFVINWGMRLSNLKQLLDDLGPEYVAVTPSQLNALYRESRQKR